MDSSRAASECKEPWNSDRLHHKDKCNCDASETRSHRTSWLEGLFQVNDSRVKLTDDELHGLLLSLSSHHYSPSVNPHIIFSRYASRHAGPSTPASSNRNNLRIIDEAPLRAGPSTGRIPAPGHLSNQVQQIQQRHHMRGSGSRSGSGSGFTYQQPRQAVRAHVQPRQIPAFEAPPQPPPAGPRATNAPNGIQRARERGDLDVVHAWMARLFDDEAEDWGAWPVRNPGDVKRTVKPYSVRRSHPYYTKKMKGFSRDVIPPLDLTPEQEEAKRKFREEAEKEKAEKRRLAREAREAREAERRALIKGKGRAKQDDSDSDFELVLPGSFVSISQRTSRDKGSDGKQREISIDDDQDLPTLQLDGEQRQRDLQETASSSSSSSSSLLSAPSTNASTSATSSSTSRQVTEGQPVTAEKALNGLVGMMDDKTPAEGREASDSPLPTPPITIAPKRTRTILAPLCSSCLTPLFLNQSSQGRPYLLKCSHIVCLPCVQAAKERNQEAKKDKSKREAFEVEGLDDIYEEMVTNWTEGQLNGARLRSRSIMPVPNASGRATKGKGKGKARAQQEEQSAGTSQQGTKRTNDDAARSEDATQLPSTSGHRTRKRARLESESLQDDTLAVPSVTTRQSKRKAAPSPRILQYSSDSENGGQDAQDDNYDPDKPEMDIETMTLLATGKSPRKGKGKATARTSAAGRKGRGRDKEYTPTPPTFAEKAEKEVPTNKQWLTCPIVGCKDTQTDLLAPLGSVDGVWEMFV